MDFKTCHLISVNKRVRRLGIACNHGIDAFGLSAAFECGLNYVFWTRFRTAHLLSTMRKALAQDRERYVIATGPTIGYFGHNVRAGCEWALKTLRTEYIDVFLLYWLGVASAHTNATQDALLQLKHEGKVRAIGTSIHNRLRAAQLTKKSAFDLLMLRYNAAHPGVERDVFSHFADPEKRPVNIVTYTATNWRRLLKRPKGWKDPPMTAGDCYRFCLSNPHVDVVLNGPANTNELYSNLNALEAGPLTAEENAWMRRFGTAVHR